MHDHDADSHEQQRISSHNDGDASALRAQNILRREGSTNPSDHFEIRRPEHDEMAAQVGCERDEPCAQPVGAGPECGGGNREREEACVSNGAMVH